MKLRKLLFLLIILFPIWVMAADDLIDDEDDSDVATPTQIQQQAKALEQKPSAQTAVAEQPTATTQHLVNSFYQWFNEVGDPNNPITMEDVQDFFAPDAVMFSNGKIVAKNTKEMFLYFEAIRTNNKSTQVLLPFTDIIISGNRAAVSYVINSTGSNDQHFKIYIIAILQFAKGKITEFSEVVYKEPVVIKPTSPAK